MDENGLDGLLAEAGKRHAANLADPDLSAEVLSLIRETQRGPASFTTRLRPLAVVGGAFVALVLTAGAAAGAIYLELPPFAEVESGEQRILTGIPVEYVTAEGVTMVCSAYVDIANASTEAVQVVRAEVESRDWSGFGQSIYDGIEDAPAQEANEVDPPQVVTLAISHAVADFVHTAAPEIANMDDPLSSARGGDPYVHTVSILCE
jgi:phenylpyruvate tautomerase PptA (4-oxalocrotonate tautomerase family)